MTRDRVRTASVTAATIVLALMPLILRSLRERRDKKPAAPLEKVFDRVDEASMESFPASDPPAY